MGGFIIRASVDLEGSSNGTKRNAHGVLQKPNAGALIIRTGFWAPGIVYTDYKGPVLI